MGYAAAVQLVTDFKDQCTDVSYTGMITEMKNTSLQSDVAGGSRQWVWQTCNEFGRPPIDMPDHPKFSDLSSFFGVL